MNAPQPLVRILYGAALASAFALATASPGRADPLGHSAVAAGCSTVGDAVAMQLDGNVPVVAGRDGTIARFAPLVDSGGTLASTPLPPRLWCTGVRGVVGLAIDAAGTLFVAGPTTVHVFARGSVSERGAFAPALATGETIAAIALLPSGAVELAIASAGDNASTRFAVYPAAARGERPDPARRFAYDAFLRPVSAIAVDSRGRTYAYDDGGEILIFPAGAEGAAKPARRVYGSATALRPAVRGTLRGSRQLALDVLGSLYAADDGTIVRFTFYEDDPATVQSDAIAYGPAAKLALVRGLATDGTNAYALSVDPASHAATIFAFSPFAREPSPAASTPVP